MLSKLEQIPDELLTKIDNSERELEVLNTVSLTYWQDVWRRFKKSSTAMLGLILIIILIILSVFAPLFSNYTYDEQNLDFANVPPFFKTIEDSSGSKYFLNKNLRLYLVGEDGRLVSNLEMKEDDLFKKQMVFSGTDSSNIIIDYSQKPYKVMDENGVELKEGKTIWNKDHILGTDGLGRDMFIRLIYGARISLLVAFIATIVNFVIGTIYGGISGYVGGIVDNIMMRIVDIINTIPLTLYVILIMVVIGAGLKSIILALGSVYWIGMARLVRGQILSIKEQEYVLAAKTIGTSSWNILIRHLLPNAMGPIIVNMTMLIPKAIFTEAFLSYIGLGIPAPKASWGTLCNDALGVIKVFPYQLLLPSIAICITMFAFNFLGDGLRDTLDPRLRK